MKYVHVRGVEVSAISYGTWHLPVSPETYPDGVHKVDVEKSEKIIKRAIDLGINFFDTANTYVGTVSDTAAHYPHSGTSERILGQVLKGYERESLVVATKVRARMASFPNGEGLSRKHIRWQIKESLSRLGMDFVDIYYIHWRDEHTPHEETLSALNDLVHEGLVHYLGISNHPAQDMIDFQEIADKKNFEKFSIMQEAYNMLQRGIEQSKVPIARQHGMALAAYVPLAQGVLAGRYLGGIPEGSRATIEKGLVNFIEATKGKVSRLKEIADAKGIKLSQLALAWLMNVKIGITVVPLIGATSVEELEEDVQAVDISLSSDDMKAIDEILSS
ncbi:MAG: aldo/keto reductase [Thermoprotei archaeon]